MTEVPVLYIGGWGRSGSTLLAHVLAEVPGFVSVGELRYVWQAGPAGNELCGCGLAFAECPFWSAVGQEAFGGWDTIDVDEVLALESAVLRHRNVPLLAMGRVAPGHARQVRRYADLTAQLYQAILTVSGASVVVDSTKNPPYAYFLRAAEASGLRLRVLHLVRDSRGVVYSWMKRVARPEVTDGGDAYFQEFSPMKAGMRWMQCNLAFDALRRLGVPTVRMRYESLAADPRGELERMFASMGESGAHDLSAVGDSVQVAGQHSVRGNPMRFAHGRQEVRADEAWRTGMARKTRSLVVLVTWPLLLRYGYRIP
ncbi:MAG TPA: hypothetical protein VGL44_15950 [Gaiellales bacterium]